MLKTASSHVFRKFASPHWNAVRTLSASRSSRSEHYDVTIVGGGIIGLGTARELISRHPDLKLCVVEKEPELSVHQTGHNSGVIHTGIYYKPGSLKAKLCVEGLKLMYKYCDDNDIPYKKCGKLIVATESEEIPRLEDLFTRAKQNGVSVQMIDGKEIKEYEPYCRGLKAIHSPNTGIVDFGVVARMYGKEFEKKGGTIKLAYEVEEFRQNSDPQYPVTVVGNHQYQEVHTRYVVTCGGLYSDRLAAQSGCSPLPKIIPFRGDYLILKPEKTYLVNGNIYPVPNPDLPFLGVHFTPRMNGDIWLGPNALLAFKREGYNFTDFNFKDTVESLSFGGLRRLIFKHFKAGMSELYRTSSRRVQVKELERYIPELTADDVIKGPSGVRAQALDAAGNLVDDFIFDAGVGEVGQHMLHVRNAPSPAATSSLSIANMVVDEVQKRFKL